MAYPMMVVVPVAPQRSLLGRSADPEVDFDQLKSRLQMNLRDSPSRPRIEVVEFGEDTFEHTEVVVVVKFNPGIGTDTLHRVTTTLLNEIRGTAVTEPLVFGYPTDRLLKDHLEQSLPQFLDAGK